MGSGERIGSIPSVPFQPGWDPFKEEVPGGGRGKTVPCLGVAEIALGTPLTHRDAFWGSGIPPLLGTAISTSHKEKPHLGVPLLPHGTHPSGSLKAGAASRGQEQIFSH